MEALISLTASSSVGNWYICTPLLTSSLMILILNLCSSLLEIVSALAIMGMMLTCGPKKYNRIAQRRKINRHWRLIKDMKPSKVVQVVDGALMYIKKSSQTEMMNANKAGHMQEETASLFGCMAHPKTTLK